MHVPEENLTRYRALKRIADQYDSLGAAHSNIGEYNLANNAWKLEAIYRKKADELRVPGKTEGLLPPIYVD